ncbi:hypothetical protein ARMGADRAFT_553001 [Armillaria gallica]|uniref:Uncharacterized protein n=1 Tax=Armillaria gallica TaxID=47427 RepID=A0A2H3CV76_ARMGA|nr:hypothetical protein ARMGADRAFT_553001 [Armillaria gallica]
MLRNVTSFLMREGNWRSVALRHLCTIGQAKRITLRTNVDRCFDASLLSTHRIPNRRCLNERISKEAPLVSNGNVRLGFGPSSVGINSLHAYMSDVYVQKQAGSSKSAALCESSEERHPACIRTKRGDLPLITTLARNFLRRDDTSKSLKSRDKYNISGSRSDSNFILDFDHANAITSDGRLVGRCWPRYQTGCMLSQILGRCPRIFGGWWLRLLVLETASRQLNLPGPLKLEALEVHTSFQSLITTNFFLAARFSFWHKCDAAYHMGPHDEDPRDAIRLSVGA